MIYTGVEVDRRYDATEAQLQRVFVRAHAGWITTASTGQYVIQNDLPKCQ